MYSITLHYKQNASTDGNVSQMYYPRLPFVYSPRGQSKNPFASHRAALSTSTISRILLHAIIVKCAGTSAQQKPITIRNIIRAHFDYPRGEMVSHSAWRVRESRQMPMQHTSTHVLCGAIAACVRATTHNQHSTAATPLSSLGARAHAIARRPSCASQCRCARVRRTIIIVRAHERSTRHIARICAAARVHPAGRRLSVCPSQSRSLRGSGMCVAICMLPAMCLDGRV